MVIPISEGMLDVGEGHQMYFAQYGRPDAPAAVVLHGGPGSSSRISMLDWFDLTQHRVVLFDQRGTGKSKPSGELRFNTTQNLIADIERLRAFLGISKWVVVGGSWGAMLGVLYAGRHTTSISGLVLRGVFLPGGAQLDWFFRDLQALVPFAWSELTAGMTTEEAISVLATLTHRLHFGTESEGIESANRWSRYENAVMDAMAGKVDSVSANIEAGVLHKYRIQSHYLSQSCFTTESAVFDAARHISAPVILVHGTHDWICPPANLVRLIDYIPDAEVRWVSRGTHTASDPSIFRALRSAVHDIFARHLNATRNAVDSSQH
ncbi:alpha/beta fold hydrolase [Candidimonas sp. SYP-B2681]|uniref:alpha/beta fold hydrolase n=1 Tax=Candidimonas sp. SYP-B2681 TaxID=2497686 RepID=UPI000F89457F|nr:alpha/beta fold hydrolase [Candidimonas sp. SYP-B2681]RTZ42413.1 alpha/beta fold hydrolase [Candidimonas sp. SYP-B2681]